MKSIFILLAFIFVTLNVSAQTPNFNDERAAFLKYNERNLNILNKEIANNQIKGIEILIAEKSKHRIESRFGHIMLRFINSTATWRDDYVVSFVADVDDEKLKPLKGINGGYKSIAEVKLLSEFWNIYILTEKRSIDRLIIPMTSEKLKSFLDLFILFTETKDQSQNSYKFLTNNCSQILGNLLYLSGVISEKDIALVPTRNTKKLNKAGISPYPTLEIPSILPLFEKLAKLLKFRSVKKMVLTENWPDNTAQIIMDNFEDKDIKMIVLQLTTLPFHIKEEITRVHHFNNGGATLSEVYGLQDLPTSLYRLCEDAICATEVNATLSNVFQSEELEKTFEVNIKNMNKKRNINPAYQLHMNLLKGKL
jgi:hypothetical protein